MVFERVWDRTCPRVWDQWEADGSSWVIQDLDPQDYVEAADILLEHLCPDETMCMAGEMTKDPVSMKFAKKFWCECFSHRLSLGCYVETDGTKTLVGLNALVPKCADDKGEYESEGEAWSHVVDTLKYVESKINILEYLGTDTILYAMGLVVKREYRGHKLGARILNAREPLCRALGIKATATQFTGIASQKSAENCGFATVVTVTLDEMADAGLNYPRGDGGCIKLMAKKYHLLS